MPKPKIKRRFSRLYINYFFLIFLGMTLMLAAVSYSVLTITQSQLRDALDEAGFRSAGKVVTVMDSTLDAMSNRAIKLATNQDILSYLRIARDYVFDYDAISLRARCLSYINMAQRAELDMELVIYSSANLGVLSSIGGSQRLSDYRNRQIVEDYVSREDVLRRSYFETRVIARYGREYVVSGDALVLTYYCGVPQGHYRDDFIAVNSSIEKLNALIINESANVDMSDGEIWVLDADGNFMFATNLARMSDVESTSSLIAQIIAESADGNSSSVPSGVRIKLDGDKDMYAYLLTSPMNGWQYIQLLPYAPYEVSLSALARSILAAIVLILLLSAGLSLIISRRVFRPIKTIIALLDDPEGFKGVDSSNSEVRYILMSVLEAYQKNILLEREMMEHFEQLRAARVRALQQQMSPHFLYNTLQAISWLVLDETRNEDSLALTAINELSNMSRYCMEGEGMLVSVKSEAAYVREYMALQKLRFGERVKLELIVDSGAEQLQLPRMSLQPLVENAFKYGMPDGWRDPPEPGRSSVPGVILVKCHRNDDMLCVSVEDNGTGMSREQITYYEEQFEKGFTLMDNKIGLINLNQRLKLMFGKSATLELTTNESGGLTVRFRVHVIPNKQ